MKTERTSEVFEWQSSKYKTSGDAYKFAADLINKSLKPQ
jgi:hypothetical protein